jgi:hypothetical protein
MLLPASMAGLQIVSITKPLLEIIHRGIIRAQLPWAHQNREGLEGQIAANALLNKPGMVATILRTISQAGMAGTTCSHPTI